VLLGAVFGAVFKLKNNLRHISMGVLLMASSIVLFFSIVSYNPIDLIETGGEFNIFGKMGAAISDFILQYTGIAAYFLVICFLRWGFIVIADHGFKDYKKKLSATFFALIILCFLLGSIKKYEFAFYNLLGGYIGFLLSDFLLRTPFFIPIYLASVICFFALSVFALSLQNVRLFQRIIAKLKLLPIKKLFIIKKSKNPAMKPPSKTETPKTEELITPPIPRLAVINPNKPPFSNAIEKINVGLKYSPPPLTLLNLNSAENVKKNQKNLLSTKSKEKELAKSLEDFGIEAEIKNSKVGPVITMYEIDPKAGTRAARIIGLSDDIARSLKAFSARINLIPGSSSLAVEIPNNERETVFLRELIDSPEYKESNFNIPICLGKNIIGDNMIVDLTTMPHLLVAGTTGSGKSVGVNAMILSILYKLSPEECQFIMIDPKMLELSVYNDIPHLLTPVVTESEKAVMALKWLTFEMERRYRRMSALSVRNIFGYNEALENLKAKSRGVNNHSNEKRMPFIVVVIDEMADLMITAGKMIEGYVQRLAQMARAAGIHVIMATQRPSVDVITGVIKANFPTRISYQVTSKIDSRTIIGMQGAEGLLGKGDMLYMPTGAKTYRMHAPFVSDTEVNNIVSAIKRTYGNVYDSLKIDIFEEVAAEGLETENTRTYSATSSGSRNDSFIKEQRKSENDYYSEALEIVIAENKPSISYIQRRLKIGYYKAANIIERMEREGIISNLDSTTGKRIILKKS
jgi:S-DNA-T family DNA segregation ATPase FtsK/SpoIIIE